MRPRSGEARPGSPGAGRGGVTAPSARPRGMHRGSRGRRRHSQVSCGKTWRSLRTLAPPRLPLSAVPGPRGGQRGGAGPSGTAWCPPGEPPWVPRLFREGHPETWAPGPAGAHRRPDFFAYLPVSSSPPSPLLLSALSPLVSEVSLLRLEMKHILGNSGGLASVSGMTSFCSFSWV